MENQNPTNPVSEQYQTPIPVQNSNRSFWKTLGIGMSIVSFCIALAVGGYILGTNKNKTTEAPTPQTTTITPDLIDTEGSRSATANWKTYMSSDMGFSINYPSGWEIVEELSNHVVLGYQDAGPRFFAEAYQNPKNLSLQEWFLEYRKLNRDKTDFTFSPVTVGDYTGIKASGAIGPYIILQIPSKDEVLVMGGESFEFNQMLSTFQFIN